MGIKINAREMLTKRKLKNREEKESVITGNKRLSQ